MITKQVSDFIDACDDMRYTIKSLRWDIAEAINCEDRAVFSIDLDTYKEGWEGCYQSQKCKVAWMYHGHKHYTGSTLEYFGKSRKFAFMADVCGISSDERLDDWLECIDTQRAPVIEEGTKIAIFCYSRKCRTRSLLTATCTGISGNHEPIIEFD